MRKRKFSKMKQYRRLSAFVLLGVITAFLVGCSKSEDISQPEPEPPYVPPVTHIYSDNAQSEATVETVKPDGTVVLSSDAKQLPKKGEIIVSGVTKGAPQGFLYRVEEIVSKDGKTEVKTSPAYIDEVIKDYNKAVAIPLEVLEVDSGSLNSGEYIRVAKTRAAGIDKTTRLEISKEIKGKYAAVKFKGYMDLRTVFKLDISNWHFNEMNASVEVKVGLDVGSKINLKKKTLDFKEKLLEIKCKPVTIMAGPVPIVITPRVKLEPKLTAKGEIELSAKILKLEGSFGYACALTKDPDPNTGKHFRHYSLESQNPFEGFTVQKMLDGIKPEAVFSGSLKFSTGLGCNFGLYDTNDNMGIGLGPAWFAKIEGDFGLKWDGKGHRFEDDDFELKDNIDVSTGIDVAGSAKLVLKNPLDRRKKLFGGEFDFGVTLAEYKIWSGSCLFPSYSDFTIYPRENVSKYKTINLKVTKNMVLAPFFKEEDYGFCYKEKGAKAQPWTYVSMKKEYPNASTVGSMVMSIDYPVSKFQPNKTYEVRAYSKMSLPDIYIRRKGGTFTMGGSDLGGTLGDVDGIEL